MSVTSELSWRGLLQDVSDADAVNALSAGTGFYVGYDPTAPSLQIGNLIPMIVSMHLARSGLQAIQLFGGATGAIGDPSGKNHERQLLSREEIERNVLNHRRIVSEIFSRADVTARFVDNFEWTKAISVIDFLRDVGKHFTVNYMLAKEVVKTRLDGEGISFTEFSYMLLQANDFLHLHTHHNCKLQIGGSDQWGNITAGLELIRKSGRSDAYALSIPLLTDSHGKKFGKSELGTIWLDANFTSPYRFHQFWMRVEDADVVKYLKVFTFLTQDEIFALEAAVSDAPEKRAAQRALADSVTTLVHGAAATALAKRSAEVLFGGSMEGLSPAQVEEIFRDVPSSTLATSQLAGVRVVDVFVSSGLAKSKGEARRLVASGGAYLNNERVVDPEAPFQAVPGALLVLRSGKKSYHLLRISE